MALQLRQFCLLKKMQHSQVTHCRWLISSPLNTKWDVLHCKSVRYEQTPVALRTTTQVIQSHTKAPNLELKVLQGVLILNTMQMCSSHVAS